MLTGRLKHRELRVHRPRPQEMENVSNPHRARQLRPRAAARHNAGCGAHETKERDDVVHSLADWEGEASYWRPGDRVEVVCRRGTDIRTLTLKLENQPLLVAPSVRTGYGMEVTDMDGAIAAQLGMPNSRGAAVARVRPSSAAEAAGLQRGDIIYQVGNVAVSDAATLTDLLRRGRGHRLIVRLVRHGQPYRAVLE